jgi:hypothetical protein
LCLDLALKEIRCCALLACPCYSPRCCRSSLHGIVTLATADIAASAQSLQPQEVRCIGFEDSRVGARVHYHNAGITSIIGEVQRLWSSGAVASTESFTIASGALGTSTRFDDAGGAPPHPPVVRVTWTGGVLLVQAETVYIFDADRQHDARRNNPCFKLEGAALPVTATPVLTSNPIVTSTPVVTVTGTPGLPTVTPTPTPSEPPAIVKSVAQNQSKTTGSSLVLTVPSAGVGVGHRLIVGFGMDSATGSISATDSRGNTYAVDREEHNVGNTRGAVLSAQLGTALLGGDTITINHPSVAARAARVIEASGVSAVDRVASASQTATTAPTSGQTNLPAQNTELVIGAIAIQGPTSYWLAPGMGMNPDQTHEGITGTTGGVDSSISRWSFSTRSGPPLRSRRRTVRSQRPGTHRRLL